MRLSVHYRVPLEDVMAWPAEHIRLIYAFMARELTPERRIETSITDGFEMWAGAHTPKGHAKPKPGSFQRSLDPWPEPDNPSERYSAADKASLATLMGGK